MDDLEISSIRRRFVRKARFLFGVPMYLVATLGFFSSVSGPLPGLLVFYAITLISTTFGIYLWGVWMWAIFKRVIVRSFELEAAKKEALEPTRLLHDPAGAQPRSDPFNTGD
jgi:hypothetical protein